MSRSVGLPRCTSSDTDQSSVSRFSRRSTNRFIRAASGGIVSLTLMSLLAVPSVRPVANDAVTPSAAHFAAAGFVGMMGDVSGIDDTALASVDGIGGTLTFGDPITPPITIPTLPGFPTPTPVETPPPATSTLR